MKEWSKLCWNWRQKLHQIQNCILNFKTCNRQSSYLDKFNIRDVKRSSNIQSFGFLLGTRLKFHQLESRFTQLEPAWQRGSKLYSKVKWPGAPQCSSATGRRPVGGIISSLLSRRHVDCSSDYWVGVASQSCHAGPHIHAGVNSKQLYENTAALIKPLSRVSSIQHTKCQKTLLPPDTITKLDNNTQWQCNSLIFQRLIYVAMVSAM